MLNTLILTVGLPRSGKSTWARGQGQPIVNPDSIRLAIHGQRFVALAEPYVWAVTETMVRALFLAGNARVILDATNTTRQRRAQWRSTSWLTKHMEIPTCKEECIRRAVALQDMGIIPVIERMAAQFEPLGMDEELWSPSHEAL